MSGVWANLLCTADSNSEGEKENDLRDCTPVPKPSMQGLASQYANADNVEACCKYLANSLAGLGFQASQLDFFSSKAQDVAAVVNIMHALVQQRSADREARTHLEEALHKARFNLQVAQRERGKLEEELKEKHTEIGNLEIKVRQAKRTCSAVNSEAATRQDHDSRRLRQASADAHLADVQVRQRDLEIERLKKQLTRALSKQRRTSTDPGEARTDAGTHADTATPDTDAKDSAVLLAASKRLPKNSPAAAALEQLQQQLAQAKKQMAVGDKRVASLVEEKKFLTARLHDLQRDFTQLLLRCESMQLGVGPSEEASQLAHKQQQQQQEDVNKLSDAELQVYMATELKVVQDRCKQLLSMPASTTSSGPSDAAAGSTPMAQLQQQLRDQDKALSRALAALRRAEAQKDAAQQRATAASQRASLLERRMTESCTTINSQQELIHQLQQQAQQAEHVMGAWQAQSLGVQASEQPLSQQQLYMEPTMPTASHYAQVAVPGATSSAGYTQPTSSSAAAGLLHGAATATQPPHMASTHTHMRAPAAMSAGTAALQGIPAGLYGSTRDVSLQPVWAAESGLNGQLGAGAGGIAEVSSEAPRSRTPRRCWNLPQDDDSSPGVPR